jgi:hypothetical protein
VSGVPSAVHRTIVCVDVEGFSDRRRTSPDQVAVRSGLYGSLQAAFARSGISWDLCYREVSCPAFPGQGIPVNLRGRPHSQEFVHDLSRGPVPQR